MSDNDYQRAWWATAPNKRKVGPGASREAAAQEFFLQYPNVKTTTTGYGSCGPWFDIQWIDRADRALAASNVVHMLPRGAAHTA
jgi:hypothetical protein